jgi:cell division protein FtsW (lipid II flippase)
MKKFQEIFLRLLTTRVAWPIVITIGLLCTASILALEMSSPERADRQKIHIVIGFAMMLVMVVPHFQTFGRLAYGMLGVGIMLLIAVFGTEPINFSRRWFQVTSTVQLQPSELVKIAFVLSIAWYLRYRKDIQTLQGLLVPCLMMVVPFVLILAEPDLGTALLFPFVLYAMLLAAGAKLRHLLAIALIVILAAPGAFPLLKPYQQERVKTLVRLWVDPEGRNQEHSVAARKAMSTDFHQLRSLSAMGSGGVWGLGERGAQYVRQVPEAYTDFVFVIIGAQWGLVGCLVVLVLYLCFFAASLEIAGSTKDPFGRLVVVGVGAMILVQALINISMTIALAPVVGIALPFVSYGGSSLLTNMTAAGLMLNVSIRRGSKSMMMGA